VASSARPRMASRVTTSLARPSWTRPRRQERGGIENTHAADAKGTTVRAALSMRQRAQSPAACTPVPTVAAARELE
jgi:hypothetical protein